MSGQDGITSLGSQWVDQPICTPPQPATDRHEASRAAFEAQWGTKWHMAATLERTVSGQYKQLSVQDFWKQWCRALDHAAQEQRAPEPPRGSAREWVKELLYKADGRNLVLDEDDALELADRADAAEQLNRDYEETNQDKRRLSREIAAILLGGGGPEGPALCDIVKYAERAMDQLAAAQAEAAKLRDYVLDILKQP